MIGLHKISNKTGRAVALVLGPLAHKVAEVQVSKWRDNAKFDIRLEYRGKNKDHAGGSIEVTLFGVSMECSLYDNRHANARK